MSGIQVRGLANVQRALRNAEKDTRLGIRNELREFAEPTRVTVESLAVARIPTVGLTWSRMRSGVTQRSIFVVPRQRGSKNKTLKRTNFSRLMMDRAMQPALDQREPELVRDFNTMLNRVADKFNRSGSGAT